jgi:predicted nucleic acid-binding protein
VAYLYVETSALLRGLLEGDSRSLQELRKGSNEAVTSALTLVEAERAVLRGARERRIDAAQQREARRRLREFSERSNVIAMEQAVLDRAAQAFAVEPVRTLDALHLASALYWEQTVGAISILSCDIRIRQNADAYGLPVLPENL